MLFDSCTCSANTMNKFTQSSPVLLRQLLLTSPHAAALYALPAALHLPPAVLLATCSTTAAAAA
jgi:hypothetical protein